jgi:general secretion pathway protein G
MKRRFEAGLTLVELAAVCAIIIILASMAVPMAEIGVKRSRELELRRTLREIRSAIDQFHFYATSGILSPLELEPTQMMYPKDFDQLVEGVRTQQGVDTKVRFLRRVPRDPLTGSDEWGKRSYQDEPDSLIWGEENLYDVFSLSEAEALDGTTYKDW